MRKLKVLICSSLFIFYFSLSFGQGWVWGEGGYGAIKANASSSPVATDRIGDAYLAGVFQSLLILGNDTLNGNGNENAFLAKYSPSGSVIWAKALSNYYWSYNNAIATDIPGYIYVAGCYSGNVQADTFNLYDGSIFNFNVSLIKYNTNGDVIWVRQSTLPPHVLNSGGEGCSVATDNMGDVLVSGLFTDTITFGNYTLNTQYNDTDAFLVKYDSNGNVLWARQSATSSHYNSVYTYYQEICSVTTDKSGNSYITGSFHDTISFGAITLISHKSYSGYLVKYSPSGTVLWAKQSTGANSLCVPYSVVIDKSGNSYLTGLFSDSIQFGSKMLNSAQIATFFVKYDTNGNVVWVKKSSPGWYGSGLTSDGFNGHIYMAGSGWNRFDSLTFDNYTLYVRQNTFTSSFVMEFDTSGNPVCGSLINNLGFQTQSANGIASYYIGITGAYVYTASTYNNDTVFCGPDTLSAHGGGFNTFIGKWETCDGQLGIQKTTAENGNILLYPNPNNGKFTLVLVSEAKQPLNNIEVYNMLGEKVFTQTLRSAQGDNLINLSNQPNGIYLYRIIDETGSLIGNGKFIIEK